MSASAPTAEPRPAERRDRSHYLYVAVIVAVIAGIVVGLLAPGVAKARKPLGTAFVNLIKRPDGLTVRFEGGKAPSRRCSTRSSSRSGAAPTAERSAPRTQA